ncbi:MAG: alcohol dehydrogenase, partial [Verrucomicrobia bacterium]|nr:alcohol dehydrogenase [Verrucomicrobiota bacterium]
RLIKITKANNSLEAEDIWNTRNLKADFNDFVVFDGNIYGFDGGLFACVDLDTGNRQWKGGRYGKGQVLLLEDSAMLFITSERGQGILVKATPEEHIELAKTQLLKGKTWNHPVVVGDRLFIRNAEEAACYKLPVKSF